MESLSARSPGVESNLAFLAYIQDLLDIAIRRKWLILSIVILSVTASTIYAWFQPIIYRSTTVILVEQQKIPDAYVRSVVGGGSVAERVSTITQQVLSRTSLRNVIDEFNLYENQIKATGYDDAIENIRKNVELETKGNHGRLESFSVSFTHNDPMTAMKVTAKLASQYIDENLKIREAFVEGAAAFLEQELEVAKNELDEKEKVLSEYKLKYLGELPGQLDSNLRTLDRLQEEKNSVLESINNTGARLEFIQKAIHDYELLSDSISESTGVKPLGLTPSAGPRDPLTIQLNQLEQELAKLSVEYTESYPDVVSLKAQIENIRTRIAERPVIEEREVAVGESQFSYDPYFQDLVATQEELKGQLGSLKRRHNQILKQMKGYQGRIERTPSREQEVLSLERDYANMRENYQRLHEKRLSSRISENLEKRQKAERFRILDPANLPTRPEGLTPFLIVIAGFAGGCGLGYGVAFALEFLKPTFRSSEDAEVSIGLPILATIPSFQYAYGKTFKSLSHTAMESDNGYGGRNGQRKGYLDSPSIMAPHTSGKSQKSIKNGFPSELGLVTKWRPGSIVAEQYRVAATRLSLMGSKSTSPVILVTSAMKNEGKTSTVANLAYTLARDLDEPTLVIDCDFKCPALHKVMSVSCEPGLAEYFHGDEPLEACLHHIEGAPLWFLPVGNVEENSVPLSKLPHLSSVISTLESRFRYILLDAPPILPLADVNVLAGLAQILLLVVRSGTTPKDIVLKAADMISPMGQSRIIMTDAWSEGMPYHVRQGYEVPYAIGKR